MATPMLVEMVSSVTHREELVNVRFGRNYSWIGRFIILLDLESIYTYPPIYRPNAKAYTLSTSLKSILEQITHTQTPQHGHKFPALPSPYEQHDRH
jgi:hypothetical protein